jgi:hypothetical protein
MNRETRGRIQHKARRPEVGSPKTGSRRPCAPVASVARAGESYALYPPKPEQYPFGYAVTLLLLEKDWGKRESIRKALKNIEDAVAKEIAKWAKEFEGLLGKLAELVMKLLPPLLAKIFDLIAGWLGDDLFDPATLTISITSPASRLPGSDFSPRETVPLLMKGGKNGRYELTYSWHVFA